VYIFLKRVKGIENAGRREGSLGDGWTVRSAFRLIRQWLESRVSGIMERIGKGADRAGISTTVRNNWIEVIYMAGIVVMSAGVVSALASPVSQQYIIYPGRDGQSIPETVINAMALVMGFGGLYFSYLSGRQTVKPRLVGFFLILGLFLIAGAIYIEMYVYLQK
jgi:hypothetical protein